MFACSMYPVDEPFLETTKMEIKMQIQRLQHHPSILLWAGNNENEAALRGNWYEILISMFTDEVISHFILILSKAIECVNHLWNMPIIPSHLILHRRLILFISVYPVCFNS